MRQVVVIGLGQFGSHLARTLVRMNCEVLAIDADQQRVDELRDEVHRGLIGDARSFPMLESVLAHSIDDAVVCLGEQTIEPSILCTLNLKRLRIKSIRSTARNDDHAQILRAVGATEIIFPERDTAERIARRIAVPELLDMFPLAENYRIMELLAPRRLHGKTLAESGLRERFDLLALATREPGEQHFRFLPKADTLIRPGQVLMLLGQELDLARFAGLG